MRVSIAKKSNGQLVWLINLERTILSDTHVKWRGTHRYAISWSKEMENHY
jgi:hypothetical protein